MEFRQLQTFVYIVQLKSFSKVAEKLFLTQPTITSHIQSLEKELDMILLNRSSKEITLTKSGQILYEHALNILELKDKALLSLDTYKGRIEGVLALAASSIPEQYVLPELILEFRKKYPEVTFDVRHYSSIEAIDKICKYDLEFGMVGTKLEHPKLSFVDLLEDQLVLIASIHWQSLSVNISIEELLEMPIILREKGSGTRIQFENILDQLGYSSKNLNIVSYLQSNEAIKEAVKLGLGISFVSEKSIKIEQRYGLLQVIPIEAFNVRRKFYFVYNKDRTLSPLSDTFKRFVLDYLN